MVGLGTQVAKVHPGRVSSHCRPWGAPSAVISNSTGSRLEPHRSCVCHVAQPATETASAPGTHTWVPLTVPRLSDDRTSFSEQQRVTAREVGPDQRTSVVGISQMLQECAGDHIVCARGRSDEFFAADPALAKQNLIFVLTRMQIEMHEYPRWGDVVNVETWFQQEGRVAARRDWLLTDAATGKLYGCATSAWVMVNYKTRRLAKMPDDIRAEYDKLMPNPERHAIEQGGTKLKLPPFPEGAESVTQHTATHMDMDMNNHINNTSYLSWLLQDVPSDVFEHYSLVRSEVDYKGEGRAGDKMHCKTVEMPVEPGPNGSLNGADLKSYLHSIDLEGADGGFTEIIRARSTWSRRACATELLG